MPILGGLHHVRETSATPTGRGALSGRTVAGVGLASMVDGVLGAQTDALIASDVDQGIGGTAPKDQPDEVEKPTEQSR